MKRIRDYIEHSKRMKQYKVALQLIQEQLEKHVEDKDPEQFRYWGRIYLKYLRQELDEMKRFNNL